MHKCLFLLPTGIATNGANVEIETQPATVEAKVRAKQMFNIT